MSEEEQKELNQKEADNSASQQQPAFAKDESNAINSLYRPDKPKSLSPKNKFSSLIGSKKVLAGGIGAGIVGIILVIGSLAGFLNIFKLDHIMKNLERKSFQRYKASLDGRSDRWMKSYIKYRLAEVEEPGVKPEDRKNRLFRADRVDTDNPFFDWYKTMRTSSFEDDLLKNQGIRFVSIAKSDGKGGVTFRTGKIVIDKKSLPNPLTDAQLNRLKSGNLDLDELDDVLKKYINLEVYDNHKIARKEIKKAIEGQTHSWQVIKRRHVRKNIQNVTGVRDWRFFETTRDKIDETRFNIRNKIVKKAIPENTMTGKYIQCLLGVSNCRASSDVADPENRSSSVTTTGDEKDNKRTGDPDNPDPVNDGSAARDYDDAMKKVFGEIDGELAVAGIKMSIIKQVLAKLNLGTAALSILDMLARIDGAIEDGVLTKMVTVARGSQALGFFQTYMTASDQLRTGEVTGKEVGQFMQTVNSVSNSEGWVDVISQNGANQARAEGEQQFIPAKNRAEYCSPEHQDAIQKPSNRRAAEREFHYLCGDKQIGGSSLAETLENWWQKTFGLVLGPLLDAYRAVGIGKIFNWVNGVVDFVLGPIIDGLIKVLGIEGTLNSVLSWALTEVASFLGAGPMMNGTEPSGVFVNTILQGGAYGAEASARYQGANKTTKESAALAKQNTIAFQNDQSGNQNLFEKYFSTTNDQSALSQTLFASIKDSTVNNLVGVFSTFAKNLSKIPMFLFTGSAQAVADDPYAAANFAGIDTYDFPKQCYDLDPATMKPAQVTNADELQDPDGNPWIPANELTWDLVNNNITFYDTLYAHIYEHYDTNADDIATKIYNCAAMDTTIRGGLGFAYGYTNDNGLEGSSSSSTGSSEADANLNWLKQDSDNIPCYGTAGETKDLGVVQSLYTGSLSSGSAPKIRLCQIKSIDGFGNNTSGTLISGGAVVSSGISENWYKLGKAIKDEKNITLSASSSFRLADSCNGNGDGNLCARPGQSLHQAGIAIDFVGMNSKNPSASCSNRASEPNNAGWLWLKENAERFGIYQYARESWHWDPGAKFGLRCDSNGDASG